MQLLFLLALVFVTYAITGFWKSTSRSLRGRIAIAVLFLFTGIGHFIKTREMAEMLPASIPMRTEILYITGILEVLGAIGILIPSLSKKASVALIAFLIAVLPANIYSAFANVDFGGHEMGPIYLLLRIPFQIFLIAWIYYFGIKRADAGQQ